MEFKTKQINLQLWFERMNKEDVEDENCIDEMNLKNTDFEIYPARGMFNDIHKYVKQCKKEGKQPIKTLFLVTNKKCLDLLDSKVHELDLWKDIVIERANAHGYSLRDIKKLSQQYKNIVFTNLNSCIEWVDATHYGRKERFTTKLIRDVVKCLTKIAEKQDACLTFGFILPQVEWMDRYINDSKDKYSRSYMFPFKNILMNFVRIDKKTKSQMVSCTSFDNGIIKEEYQYGLDANADPKNFTDKETMKIKPKYIHADDFRDDVPKAKPSKKKVDDDDLDLSDWVKPW